MNHHLKRLLAFLLVLTMLAADLAPAAAAAGILTLPSSVKIIEDEAFYGDSSIEKVIVPEGATEIGSKAFGASSVKEIELPGTLEKIAGDAFADCEEVLFICEEDSLAYSYAQEHDNILLPEDLADYPESQHPYPDSFNHTWVYDAGEDAENVTILFSQETEVEEDFDFITIRTLGGTEVGTYTGKELAGASILVESAGFQITLNSDEAWGSANACYGFKIEDISVKRLIPLRFDSLTAEADSLAVGETIRWNVEISGGKGDVFCDYLVLLGQEEVASGTVEAPGTIEYMPLCVGEYRLIATVRDSGGTELPMKTSTAVTATPSTAYPESAHPYAASADMTWAYAADNEVESLFVTFSEDTQTESGKDFIYLYDRTGAQIGKYSGTELAGQTIEIFGSSFSIRLTSNASVDGYGFSIQNIRHYIPGPLTFVSLTPDKAKAKVGDLITWTMETAEGRSPVTYAYSVTLGEEEVASGTATRPEGIEFVPTAAGDYTVSVVATDAEGVSLPAQTSAVRIAAREVSPAELFTYQTINGLYCRISGYTGTDPVVIVPETLGEYTVQEIGKGVFQDHQELVSVLLPDTVTTVQDNAFRNCDSLKLVDFGAGITAIRANAFYDCDGLVSFTFPDTVTTTGASVLRYCDNLREVHFSASWATAGEYTLADCPRITALSFPEGLAQIPANAFRQCKNIESVILPTGMLTLGKDAFNNCTNLKNITFNEELLTISDGAFYQCAGLTELVIPDSVTYLGGLGKCTNLTSIQLPASLQTVGEDAFEYCSGLTELEFSETLKTIGDGAFQHCTGLTDVVFLGGLEYLGIQAFRGCTNLENALLPDTVKTIGNHAFQDCKKLQEFHYPVSWEAVNNYTANGTGHILEGCVNVTKVEIPEGVTRIPELAFYGCVYLKEITFPTTLKIIDHQALEGCTGLTELVFHEGLETIGKYTFQDCINLEHALLPDSVKTIGNHAFLNCVKLQEFRYPVSWASVTNYTINGRGDILEGCPNVTEIIVPEGATRIPSYAFWGMVQLAKITLPSTLTEIGDNAFGNCTGLTEIEFPGSLKKIGDGAFQQCTGFTEFNFPNGLETVGIQAFLNCENLEDALLPDSVKTIGNHAFQGCAKLNAFHYPLNWTSVNNYTANGTGHILEGCVEVTEVTIPEGVTKIPEYAFFGCTVLENIIFPTTLKTIGDHAIEGCTGLAALTFHQGLETVGRYAFQDCTNLQYALLPDSVKTIGNHAFLNCGSLKAFHHPVSWTKVDNYTLGGRGHILEGCENVTEVVIPEGVTKIPAFAYFGASHVTNFVLPSTLKTIDANAFGDCTGFTYLAIPHGVTTIGANAFDGCENAEKIYVPTSVTSIDKTAFANCPKLTIHCEWGSYALQFAINNSLPYFYLSLTGASWPAGTLYRGNDFGLYGYVRASEPISSITATIYNWDGSQVLQTVTVNPYVLDYGLAGAINANLRFQDLPLGSYCYTLVATAGEETELMQQTTFSIVPPPLAIYVQDGATPSGLYSAASQIPFGGTIVSNYPITSVHAALTNMDTGATVREGWASPNAYSYALGNLSGQLSFATLGDGQYFLKVTAVSNGETRVLSEAGFQLLVGAGEITEEMYDDLIAFASKAANRNIFSTQYAAQVVNDMKAVDGIILFYDNLMSASLRDLIKQTCSLGDNDQLVKLYKRELIDMIDAGNYGGFDPIVSNTELHDLLLGSLQEGGTIASGLGLSEEVETLADTINTGLGELEKFTSAVGELNELYELLISVTLNAERGMQVLDFLSQSYGSAVNNELRTALYELKQAYISDCAAVTHGVFDILKDVALDEAEDAVGKLAGKLAEKITDMSFNLGTSLIKVTSKLAMTATGLDSVAESYRVFFVRYDVLIVSINSYWKAFDRVKNGDHSAEALAALSTAIHITRSAWIRHREAICGILSAVYSIGNAALEYENSAAFRALKDLTPVSMR